MKVQCWNCKKLTHNTTKAFDPDIRPTRDMVELLEPFKSWGYGDGFQDLECPACEAPLAPSGRLRVVADNHGSDMVKERTEQVVEMFRQGHANTDDIKGMIEEEIDFPSHEEVIATRTVKLTDNRDVFESPPDIKPIKSCEFDPDGAVINAVFLGDKAWIRDEDKPPDIVESTQKAKLITKYHQPLPPGAPSGHMLTPEESQSIYTAKVKSNSTTTVELAEGFPCEICGKVCKSQAGLGSHERSHKEQTEA